MITFLAILVTTILGILILRRIYGDRALMVLTVVVAILCIMAMLISIFLGEGYNAIMFGLLAILYSQTFFNIKRVHEDTESSEKDNWRK